MLEWYYIVGPLSAVIILTFLTWYICQRRMTGKNVLFCFIAYLLGKNLQWVSIFYSYVCFFFSCCCCLFTFLFLFLFFYGGGGRWKGEVNYALPRYTEISKTSIPECPPPPPPHLTEGVGPPLTSIDL